jgi:hypothetical protein
MRTVGVNLRYRPVRAGICIKHNDVESLHGVIRDLAVIWGGMFCPIIPEIDGTVDEDILAKARPDLLLFHPPRDGGALLAERPELAFVPSRTAILSTVFTGGSTLLDLRSAIGQLRRQGNFEPKMLVSVRADAQDPLNLAFSMYFGCPSHPMQSEFGPMLQIKEYAIRIDEPLPPDPVSSMNCVGIKMQPGRLPFATKTIFVGDCCSFDDLVAFWNVRASGVNAWFWDPSQRSRLFAATIAFLDELSECVVKAKCLEVLRKDLPGVNFVTRSTSPLGYRFPPIAYLDEVPSNCTIANASMSFQLPDRPYESVRGQQLMLSIAPGDVPGDDVTMRLPEIAALGPLLSDDSVPGMFYTKRTIRTEYGGFAVLIDSEETQVDLPLFETASCLRKSLRALGINAEPSEPGLVARQLIKQIGGLAECAIFKVDGLRKLLRRYTARQHFDRAEAIKLIKGIDDQKMPDGSRAAPKTYPNLSTPALPHFEGDLLFTRLLETGLIRAGVVLVCAHCDLSFWFRIDDAADRTRCTACGNTFPATSQLRDRRFSFRRSGMFGVDSDQHGCVPVLLTMNQLYSNLPRGAFLYDAALNIRYLDGPPCESDFCCIFEEDERPALVLAECKGLGEIEEADVKNLTRASIVCGINAFVVLSKLTEFSERELTVLQRTGRQFGFSQYILLTPIELDTRHPFEARYVDDYSDNLTVSLSSLVAYSQKKYGLDFS